MQAINLKPKSTHLESMAVTAILISEHPSGFFAKTEHGQYSAKPAVSCLVKPVIGDTVLLYMDENGNGYILSILDRIKQQSTCISVENGLMIESKNDNITLAAREAINLASTESVSISSQDVAISSHHGLFQINKVDLVSDAATVHAKSSRIFTNTIETVATTLTQRVQNSFRFVEKIDQLTAGNLMQSIRNLMSVKTRQAVILAEQDVKIDGERIHMG